MLSELLHDAVRSTLHSTHCIHQLLPPLKFMPRKLCTSHCAFALPYCHYNLHKHSFVLQCIFDGWQGRGGKGRGTTSAEKLRGTKIWVPTLGCLAPGPKARLGDDAGEGCPLSLWGSGGITPGKLKKTQMLNPAFRWPLAVKFLAFYRAACNADAV